MLSKDETVSKSKETGMKSLPSLLLFGLPAVYGDSYLMGGTMPLCWVSKYVKGSFVSGSGSSLTEANSVQCPSGMSIDFITPKPSEY